MRPWASHFTLLSLHFSICKMGMEMNSTYFLRLYRRLKELMCVRRFTQCSA